MKSNFALSLLVAVAAAQGQRPTRSAQEAKFHNFAAKYNKHYDSVSEE